MCCCRWYYDEIQLAGERSDTLVVSRIDRRLSDKTVSCEATNKVGNARQSASVRMRCKRLHFIQLESSFMSS